MKKFFIPFITTLVIGVIVSSSFLGVFIWKANSMAELQTDFQNLTNDFQNQLDLCENAITNYGNLLSEMEQLTVTYQNLLATYNILVDDNSVLQDTYNILLLDYGNLNDTYNILVDDNSVLQDTYDILLLDYGNLLATYNILVDDNSALQYIYDILLMDYENLLNTYNILLSDNFDLQNIYDILLVDYENLLNTYNILVADNSILQDTYDILLLDYENLQSTYDILLLDYELLVIDYNILLDSLTTLQISYNSLQSDYDDLTNDFNILQSDYDNLYNLYLTLESEYSLLQTEYDLLNTNYNTLLNDYGLLQNYVDSLEIELNAFKNYIKTLILPLQFVVFAEAVRRYYMPLYLDGHSTSKDYYMAFAEYCRDVILHDSNQENSFQTVSNVFSDCLHCGADTEALVFYIFWTLFWPWVPNWGMTLYELAYIDNVVQWCIDEMDYESDSEIRWQHDSFAYDYVKFSVETAFRTMGDSEDQAILTASYLESCSLKTAIVITHDPNHPTEGAFYHTSLLLHIADTSKYYNSWSAPLWSLGSNDPYFPLHTWLWLDTSWDIPFGSVIPWLSAYGSSIPSDVMSIAICDIDGVIF